MAVAVAVTAVRGMRMVGAGSGDPDVGGIVGSLRRRSAGRPLRSGKSQSGRPELHRAANAAGAGEGARHGGDEEYEGE